MSKFAEEKERKQREEDEKKRADLAQGLFVCFNVLPCFHRACTRNATALLQLNSNRLRSGEGAVRAHPRSPAEKATVCFLSDCPYIASSLM